MNFKKLGECLNAPAEDKIKRLMVLACIAMDKDAIKDVLEMLQNERSQNNELLTELNLNLSRAEVFISEYTPEETKLKKGEQKKTFDKRFVLDKIAEFYITNKKHINHCFNRFN